MFDPLAQPWQRADAGLSALPARRMEPDFLRRTLATPPKSWPCDPPGDTAFRYVGREGPLVAAAVLIPLVMHNDGLCVMLTQRAAHLNAHAGQISFPGGRLESGDASPEAGALRETLEETGLAGEFVEVLGGMPAYVTASGFSVTPVVGLVHPGFSLTPDSTEVADVFEVPLPFLMNPANHRLHCVALPPEQTRYFYSMSWQNRCIWGATAAMLRNLYHLLRSA